MKRFCPGKPKFQDENENICWYRKSPKSILIFAKIIFWIIYVKYFQLLYTERLHILNHYLFSSLHISNSFPIITRLQNEVFLKILSYSFVLFCFHCLKLYLQKPAIAVPKGALGWLEGACVLGNNAKKRNYF